MRGVRGFAACLALFCLLIVPKICLAQKIVIKPWDQGASEIKRHYEEIPSAWKPKNDIILASTTPDQAEFNIANKLLFNTDTSKFYDIAGEYFDQKFAGLPIIVIEEKSLKSEGRAVFRHEYGHHVYMALLTSDERDAWRKIWSKARDFGKLPSLYAQVNENEGLAEAFKFYVDDKPLDKSLRDFLDSAKKRLQK